LEKLDSFFICRMIIQSFGFLKQHKLCGPFFQDTIYSHLGASFQDFVS